MIRIANKISAFFLFLAVVVFYAHLVIPHDHHLAESDASREESCPVSNKGSSHNSGFPVHCHAFNDLTSEKAITYIIVKNIRSAGLESGTVCDLTDAVLTTSRISILVDSKQGVNTGSLKLSSLRAPPSIG